MKRNAGGILVILAVFFALVLLNFLFLVDSQESQEDEWSASRSSYRSSPFGTSALYTLLEENEYPVTRSEVSFAELDPDEIGTLVVVAPRIPPTDDELARLSEWISEGGRLILVDRDPFKGIGDLSASTSMTPVTGPAFPSQPTPYTRGVSQVELSGYARALQVAGPTVTHHLISNSSVILADARLGEGRVVFLTDPFVVANNGLARADNLTLVLNLLADAPAGVIAFDEYHHGYGSGGGGGLLAYFRGTPVPWMVGQMALLVVVMVYSFGRRFGRPVQVRRDRRTTNLEFVSSMANISRLARASDLAVQNIYREFHTRLCRFSGLPPRVEPARLAAGVARRARLDERELRDLLDRCERAAAGEKIGDSELLELVTRIRDIESHLSA